jgi:hypothetical protein
MIYSLFTLFYIFFLFFFYCFLLLFHFFYFFYWFHFFPNLLTSSSQMQPIVTVASGAPNADLSPPSDRARSAHPTVQPQGEGSPPLADARKPSDVPADANPTATDEVEVDPSKVRVQLADCKAHNVTVYRDRAHVARQVEVALVAGVTEVTVRGLSNHYERNSMRVGGTGAATILEVVESHFAFDKEEEAARAATIEALQAKLAAAERKMQSEKRLLLKRLKRLQTEEACLCSLNVPYTSLGLVNPRLRYLCGQVVFCVDLGTFFKCFLQLGWGLTGVRSIHTECSLKMCLCSLNVS